MTNPPDIEKLVEAAAERAAIVTWLRHFNRDGSSPAAAQYANMIERGEHRALAEDQVTSETERASGFCADCANPICTVLGRCEKRRQADAPCPAASNGSVDPIQLVASLAYKDGCREETRDNILKGETYWLENTKVKASVAVEAVRSALSTTLPERDDVVEALVEALREVEYRPGDYPIVPVKHDAFVRRVEEIVSKLKPSREGGEG